MSVENFSWLLLDDSNSPITGADPLPTIVIRRLADDYIFDWDDGNFKASGWTTKNKNLPELDSSLFPGVYETNQDLDSFTGKYYSYVEYAGSVTRRASQEFNVKEGVVTNLLQGLTDLQDTKVDDLGINLGDLNDFDPANDTVAKVALVDVTTENTDMRGTEDANTLEPASASAIASAVQTVLSDEFAALGLSVAQVDSIVEAIKLKTDDMVFTVDNELDINIKSQNDVTLYGAGVDADPWRGNP
jgi:hypothetical protein